MSRFSATSFAALGALFLAAGPVSATDLGGKDSVFAAVKTYNWSGVYLGGQLGFGHTVVGDEDGQGGIDLNGILGGIRAGADVQRGALVLGVFGEYNWSDEALEAFGTTFIEQTDDWSANARIGFAHGPTLFYAAGGYGQYSFESPIFSGGEETIDGWNARIGIEHQINSAFTIGLEAMRVWLDLDSIDGGEGLDDVLDATDDRVLARITYRMNSTTLGF